MNRISVIGLAALFSLAGAQALAQSSTAPAKKAKPIVVAKASPKAAAAKPVAAAAQALTPTQLDVARYVHTGKAECEFNQSVSVDAIDGRPGHFNLAYKNHKYTMVPEETTTGAVRLQDRKAGVVWLQIANKSMLMNSKIGQRMVDGCTHAQQRAAAGTPRPSTLQ